MSDDFYARLPVLQHFADITDPTPYTPIPGDWLVLVADVEGSTAAVQAGRYRDGDLVHDLYISDHAVVTYPAHERMGQQVHFIDSTEGGYATAAALKRCTLHLATAA